MGKLVSILYLVFVSYITFLVTADDHISETFKSLSILEKLLSVASLSLILLVFSAVSWHYVLKPVWTKKKTATN